MSAPLRVAVLGSTGSIGLNTLDVLERHRDRYEVFALAARSNVARLRRAMPATSAAIRRRRRRLGSSAPRDAAAQRRLADGGARGRTSLERDRSASRSRHDHGRDRRRCRPPIESRGRALRASDFAGEQRSAGHVRPAVRASRARRRRDAHSGRQRAQRDLQCMGGSRCLGGRRVLLTASGGPFLRTPAADLRNVTPDQACAHPRWVMGRKISVDSATLMNKGLELIEACLLFSLPARQVDVVVHPQSIVHSLVEYVDGSMLAQLGNPDMRTPIAHALGWPERLTSGVESLDILRAARLDFEAPDLERFPALALARSAAEAGGTAPAVLNAANEVAVGAFLEGRCRFTDIVALIERVLARRPAMPADCVADILAADGWARREAQTAIAGPAGVHA
jgi:1-deoxy-D-xylulose-5-phosphate reductoisomerase